MKWTIWNRLYLWHIATLTSDRYIKQNVNKKIDIKKLHTKKLRKVNIVKIVTLITFNDYVNTSMLILHVKWK